MTVLITLLPAHFPAFLKHARNCSKYAAARAPKMTCNPYLLACNMTGSGITRETTNRRNWEF